MRILSFTHIYDRKYFFEWVGVLLLAMLIVSLSFFQTIAFAKAAPRGTTYFLVNNYPPDYYWYLSMIEQGREGNLAIATRYTTTIFSAVPVNLFFSLLGIVGRYSYLANDQLYTLARFIFGVTQLMAVYFLIRRLSSRLTDRLFYFLIVLLSQSFTHKQGEQAILYGGFWSAFDPFARFSNLPHHMAANTAMILSIGLISFLTKTRIVIASLLLVVAGMINPGIYPIAIPLFVLGFLWNYPISIKLWKYVGGFLLMQLLVVLYFAYIQNTTFPWNEFSMIERRFSPVVNIGEILPIIGISGYAGIVGLFVLIGEKNICWRFILSWSIVQLFSLWVVQYYVPLSGIRFIQTLLFVPFGLLTAGSWLRIVRYIPQKLVGIVLIAIGIGLYGIVGVDAWRASVDQQLASVNRETGSLLQHPPASIRLVIAYLQKHARPGDVTASTWWLSTILPSFTPVRVFSGHPTFSYDPSPYTDEHIRLLQYPHVDEAQNILARRNVRYVVTDGGERASNYFPELGLREVFVEGEMRVFERTIK